MLAKYDVIPMLDHFICNLEKNYIEKIRKYNSKAFIVIIGKLKSRLIDIHQLFFITLEANLLNVLVKKLRY